MEVSELDLEQRLDIVEQIFRSVIGQESPELVSQLSRYKTENVQWVLNQIAEPIGSLHDDLEIAYDKLIRF